MCRQTTVLYACGHHEPMPIEECDARRQQLHQWQQEQQRQRQQRRPRELVLVRSRRGGGGREGARAVTVEQRGGHDATTPPPVASCALQCWTRDSHEACGACGAAWAERVAEAVRHGLAPGGGAERRGGGLPCACWRVGDVGCAADDGIHCGACGRCYKCGQTLPAEGMQGEWLFEDP